MFMRKVNLEVVMWTEDEDDLRTDLVLGDLDQEIYSCWHRIAVTKVELGEIEKAPKGLEIKSIL